MTEACRAQEFLTARIQELQKNEGLSLREDILVIAVHHPPILNGNSPTTELEFFHGTKDNGSDFQFKQISRDALETLGDNRVYDPHRSISRPSPNGITIYNIYS